MFRYTFLILSFSLAVAPLQASGASSPFCETAAPWLGEGPDRVERQGSSSLASPSDEETDALPLDVATYNLHSGLGSSHAFFRSRDQVIRNLSEIARSLAAVGGGDGPDIVALNEVDFGSRRSGWIDQARFIAEQLETYTGSAYQVVRGETWRRDLPGFEVRFGNAALVRLPLLESTACRFDQLDRCTLPAPTTETVGHRAGSLLARLLSEPRGAIRVSVDLHGRPIDVVVTHLDAFDMRAREAQADLLLSRFVIPGRTTVVLGDMNAVPTSLTRDRWLFSDDRTHAILATGSLADACITLASQRHERSLAAWATYPAGAPRWGLDWVLASPELTPQSVATIGETASDHRGLHVLYRLLRDEVAIQTSRLWHGRICERLRSYDSSCATAGG